MGPQFGSSLVNLGIEQEVREAVAGLGKDLDDLITLEEEPGLGNGGLGRLAACYLDSLATLEIPAIGYDIRYEFGIFDQEIRDGWQIEITDLWLHNGNPWEIAKPDVAYYVNFGGHCESYHDNQGYSRNLCQHDPFLVLADYADYVACQDKVTAVWQDQEQWTRMSILNTARAGKFSSDRAIREYCDEIWKVRAVAVELPSNERDL
jgi:glucan phosphorylase